MAAPQLAVGSAAWALRWLYQGRCPGQTGFHLVFPGFTDPDFTGLHELHEDLLVEADIFFRNYTVDTLSLDLSRLYIKGFTTSLTETLHLTTPAGAGGYGGAAETAVHVRQIVEGARRSENGHFFLPPPPVSEIDFGAELQPTYISSLSTGLLNFRNGVQGIVTSMFPTVEFAVIHRSRARVPVDPPVARPVVQWVISPKLSVQRRRLRAQLA